MSDDRPPAQKGDDIWFSGQEHAVIVNFLDEGGNEVDDGDEAIQVIVQWDDGKFSWYWISDLMPTDKSRRN